MTDHADAARRRELQRRAFAPAGGLTPEEAEELRMLSAPAATQQLPDVEPATAPAAPAELPASETPTVTESSPESVRAPEPAPEQAVEWRRPRRALAVVITVAALVLGVGAGWLSSPRTAQASPAMTSAQQQIDAEIVASGDFDAGSVRFRGEKDGAALWSAMKNEMPCVVLSVEGERRTGCASETPVNGETALAITQLQIQDGDEVTSYTGYLLQTLSGEWAPMIQQMSMASNDWKAQYNETERALLDVLEKAGLHGPDLTILGYDGDIPIWATWGPDMCIAVVDPDTSAVQQHCTDLNSDNALEIALHDSIYRAVWRDQRGPTLTIEKQAEVSKVFCDAETGDCTSIDDTTGEIG